MKKNLFICASAAVVAFASHAQAEEGAYASFGAGWNGPDSSALEGSYSAGLPGGNSVLGYDSGFGVMGALGYDFGNALRTEVELSHRDNDIDGIQTAANGSGDLNVTALLLNFIWDVELEQLPFTPYIGGGIGGAYVEANALATAPAVRALNIADEDYALAYQGIAGIAYEVAENLALDLSYRYFATDDLDFATTVPGSVVSTDYEAHGVFAGLRWSFAAPAPAPAPAPVAPAPEPVVTPDDLDFTVYFDYNKSNLTDAASALIAQAAQTALENDVDTVVVEGHTDTSGSSAYNQVLSARRAEAVRQGLIANGIDADAIVLESFGEDRPATPTEDGVREPLNRRAEVTISFE